MRPPKPSGANGKSHGRQSKRLRCVLAVRAAIESFSSNSGPVFQMDGIPSFSCVARCIQNKQYARVLFKLAGSAMPAICVDCIPERWTDVCFRQAARLGMFTEQRISWGKAGEAIVQSKLPQPFYLN